MTPRGSVLVVDDSEIVLEMTAELMRAAGVEAVGVSDPCLVSSTIAAERPSLVLVDLTMDAVSGEQVVSRILEEFPDAAFPVLLFSGHSESELEEAAARCGADGVVVKGDDEETFVREVKRWIALSGL